MSNYTKINKAIRNKKRCYFQLLEVMVAAFLILICAAPALKIHISMYLEQNALMRQNQRDHLAHLAYAEIVEKMYKNEIPLEDILEKKEFTLNSLSHDEQSFDLIHALHQMGYQCRYFFTNKKTPEEKENKNYSLLNLILKLDDISFSNQKSTSMEYVFVTYLSHQVATSQTDEESHK